MNFPNKVRWKNAHRKPGTMNKAEASYAAELDLRKSAGDVLDFRFEAFKLKLADNTTITPDFTVLMPSGHIELHDVKGTFFPEHNRVKWKVGVETFPWFTWVLVRPRAKKNGGGFDFERFE